MFWGLFSKFQEKRSFLSHLKFICYQKNEFCWDFLHRTFIYETFICNHSWDACIFYQIVYLVFSSNIENIYVKEERKEIFMSFCHPLFCSYNIKIHFRNGFMCTSLFKLWTHVCYLYIPKPIRWHFYLKYFTLSSLTIYHVSKKMYIEKEGMWALSE